VRLAGLNALAMIVRSGESSQLRVSDLNLRQSERLGFCTDDLQRKEMTRDGFAGDCAFSQSVRVLRRSLAARPASRAFPGRRGVDSEPETVPGAPRAPKPAPRSLFRDGQVRFRWRGLGSADAEQRRLRRPGDRQVEGADQAMRDQLRRLLSQPQ
jgi:hypothetical protein